MRTTLPRFRPLIQEQPLSNRNLSIMQGVTRHIFPLRADMARLRRFVDSFLNFVDDEDPPPFYFQPVAPLVIFELLYYPYLTVASRNLISYPQREMSFAIPLECYAIEDGVLVFKQYATCIPFLYVDEELSAVSGRDLFGLPKVALKFQDLIDQVRPDAPTQIGRLTLRVPGPLGDHYVTFIEVYREPSRYASFRRTPGNLISALPEAIRSYSSLATEVWEALARPPIRGYDNRRDLQSILGMFRTNTDALTAALPMLQFTRQAPGFSESSADEILSPLSSDVISLKQARDAERLDLVSYQALVRSTMYLDRINDGGFLFGPLASDPNSDITIKIHHVPLQPIVESLGLLTEDTTSEGGAAGRSVGAGGRRDDFAGPASLVSTLKPLFPQWLNVDLAYGLGTNLYWRGRNTVWSSCDSPGPPSAGNRYLTFGGGALQEDASRLVSPEGIVWILTLELDPKDGAERLNRLCETYLSNDCYAFQLCEKAKFVWMFVRNLNNTAEGRGTSAEQEIEFAALVDWFAKKNGRASGAPLGTALMPLYILTDSQTAAFTESEVFGRPTDRAEIDFMRNTSISKDAVVMLKANTLLLPELYSGGAPINAEILSLEVRVVAGDFMASPPITNDTNILNFPSVGLKQMVDCRLPGRDDFQAIVMRVMRFDSKDATNSDELKKKVAPLIENKSPLTTEQQSLLTQWAFLNPSDWSLKISRYEALPLTRKMGLHVDHTDVGRNTTSEVIKPSKISAVRAQVQERGSLNFAWRLGNSPWMYHDRPLRELEKIQPGIANDMQNLPQVFVRALWGRSRSYQQ